MVGSFEADLKKNSKKNSKTKFKPRFFFEIVKL